MRSRGWPAVLVLAMLTNAGCSAVLYPVARAFGGAKESELKISREAFGEMKGIIATGPLRVAPARVFRDWQPGFEAEPAALLLARLRREVNPAAELEAEDPTVPETEHGSNQLRYENERGRVLAAWVAARKAPSGFWFFTEVLANREGTEVYGGYAWVVDASGRIAYGRLFNSHMFGASALPGIEPFLDLVVQTFVRDLGKEPIEVFPKYGIG